MSAFIYLYYKYILTVILYVRSEYFFRNLSYEAMRTSAVMTLHLHYTITISMENVKENT